MARISSVFRERGKQAFIECSWPLVLMHQSLTFLKSIALISGSMDPNTQVVELTLMGSEIGADSILIELFNGSLMPQSIILPVFVS